MRFFGKKSDEFQRRKTGNDDEEAVFFSRENRFHFFKAFFTKNKSAQNMPVLADRVVKYLKVIFQIGTDRPEKDFDRCPSNPSFHVQIVPILAC